MIIVGRSRELLGLAAAIVKLWAKSAIAKIAIKRGVLNTCNERMAEELKVRSKPDNIMSWESNKVFLLSEILVRLMNQEWYEFFYIPVNLNTFYKSEEQSSSNHEI